MIFWFLTLLCLWLVCQRPSAINGDGLRSLLIAIHLSAAIANPTHFSFTSIDSPKPRTHSFNSICLLFWEIARFARGGRQREAIAPKRQARTDRL
jgi:hypothetical protein